MKTDAELLRDYAQNRSEDAFSELANRNLPIVYAAALRQTGDAELAQDVSQAVFLDLARKSRSLASHELLIGWLFTATRFYAANAVRGNRRRQDRERAAASTQEATIDPEVKNDDSKLAVALDTAIEELPREDRDAVLLRFFQGKGLKEVGAAFGISEDAARMRVNRAVGKLHSLLETQGIAVSAAALGGLLVAEAASAAPVGLAQSISNAVGAGTTLAKAATAAAGMTAMQKAAMVAVLAAVAGIGIYEAREELRLRHQNQVLQQERAVMAGELEALQRGKNKLADQVAMLDSKRIKGAEDSAELLRLRGEAARLRRAIKDAADEARLASTTQSALLGILSNVSPVKRFTSTTKTSVSWDEGLVAGGWKIPSGKRAIMLATFYPVDEAGNLVPDASGPDAVRQVVIKVHVLEYTDDAGNSLGFARFNVAGQVSDPQKIGREQIKTMFDAAQKQEGVDLLAAPEVVTSSGQQAEMRATDFKQTPGGEEYFLGPEIDVVPTVSPDGQSVQVTMQTQLNCPTQPPAE